MENWRRRISHDFEGGTDFSTRTVKARVITATELKPELQEVLRKKLDAMVDGDVRVVFGVDPSIVGGMVIHLGSRIIDMSVASELRRLSHQIQERLGQRLEEVAVHWGEVSFDGQLASRVQ